MFLKDYARNYSVISISVQPQLEISGVNETGTELSLKLDIATFTSAVQRQLTEADKHGWARLWSFWTQAGLQFSVSELWLSC